ncbi:adenylate/guanylate cyclase domain-containing protein (plasmid) [Rhizobium ruizarguesonis]|uniref:Adenylate/guanylate cyclase domain-containing protein n=1 Tax=Rhizobium ruizarguesonis TaxID=2081791 RepID=A0ABY1X1R7_9HYPH|nr:adenylate/guanylate cyclase domain-containing protein [Rhizobium ruizarguesonis]TAU71970.1 adenylate/guanylate cyclase domain-containing protein [Rhizobium ruizarguesonis]TAV23629.1 adenylate/guanylate cyclase domain-containing protein [Rhizobium ruizarguesonis]TAV24671.1 adenylate/guanylate cyclase domain-containing protein [Rhizobium ruizarguesonis]TAW49801.1 adenylate/guanylate cyclase domain-containing protein [Rhizobium ruizarguesonis]TAW85383.1 adenylate/guanylate cyclase domain-conta
MTTVSATGIFSERTIRRARLGSGLVIFIFVLLHLSNHAIGLISVAAADKAAHLFLAIWRNPLGTAIFYSSVLTHIALVLRAIYMRRSLVMPKGEMAQIVLGLLIPLLLLDHVIGTRIAHEFYGYIDDYETVVGMLWIRNPANGARQALGVVAVWIHGCIGIHFWLRYRSWYPDFAPLLLALAILVPVLSLLGFVEMGRTLADPSYQQSMTVSAYKEGINTRYASNPEVHRQVAMIRAGLYGAFSASLLIVVAARARRKLKERLDQVAVHYPGGEVIRVPRGFSVLEASRLGGLPHYSVCGGKGQCSTCRVQILGDYDSLPAPDKMEETTLRRINAGPDVRLACQLRPNRDVAVAPLLVPAIEAALPANSQETSPGREREIAVLFVDIRHFTTMTETRLPFDVVFLLNRYFAIIGKAVEQSGGRLDKFIGDGAMALFGLNTAPEEACRQALNAAAAIVAEIEKLAAELADELALPLRIAIGIHTGPAVVGTMGYGRVRSMTAIGDTVNVASRLESAAKEFEAAIVISEPVASLSGANLAGIESREISVRGRALPLKVYVIPREKAAEPLEGKT